MTESQPYVILSIKKNAEAQSRQKEMIEHAHVEYQHSNAENPGKDNLPQESSTPRNNKKDNGEYHKQIM